MVARPEKQSVGFLQFAVGNCKYLQSHEQPIEHRMPLGAASPREFMNVYRGGKEPFVFFVTTIIAVLATDLLLGIAIGIATKFAIHYLNGVSLKSFLFPDRDIEERDNGEVTIRVAQSAVFSNWIAFRKQVVGASLTQGKSCTLDFANTHVVDHNVLEKLHKLEDEFQRAGVELIVVGLEGHQTLSVHTMAAQKLTVTV